MATSILCLSYTRLNKRRPQRISETSREQSHGKICGHVSLNIEIDTISTLFDTISTICDTISTLCETI